MIPRPGKIIVLEGLPGIGKTTLGESLQAHDSNYLFIPEVVNVGKLKIYLADMQNKAADFQFDTQFETFVRLRQAAKHARAGRDVIVDRGLEGNLCFALIQHEAGMISTKQMNEYRAQFHYNLIPELRGIEVKIVYMYAEAEFCLDRIRSRGRAGEDSYNLDYLKKLKEKHDELLGDATIVNCDSDTQFTPSGHLPSYYVKALMVL
uniref:Deoxynucleoside kinase domain-containing protein n=1 Tax=viral metagenome TaxID=1070528 RepID=A0A6C0CFH6_9ZZZZ